jgi:hypothetical protein
MSQKQSWNFYWFGLICLCMFFFGGHLYCLKERELELINGSEVANNNFFLFFKKEDNFMLWAREYDFG